MAGGCVPWCLLLLSDEMTCACADRSAFPEPRRPRPSGGGRGLPGGSVRGHQLVCHPRKEGDDHAQGHPAGPENQGGEGLGRLAQTL